MIKIPNSCDTCNVNQYLTSKFIADDKEYIDPRFNKPFVIVPYFKKIAYNTTEPFWTKDLLCNFNSYDIFVLKTRLRAAINSTLDIQFYFYRYKLEMKCVLELQDAQGMISFTAEEADYYQQLVDSILVKYPDHCTLFYASQNFDYDKKINKQWIVTVIPYLLHVIDVKYQPTMYNNQLLVKLDTEAYEDYQQQWERLQQQMMDDLYTLYKRGTVVLIYNLQHEFINKFKLIPLRDPRLFHLDKDSAELFVAPLVTHDNMTEYLLDVLAQE